jgi:uncharacterized protein
VVVSPGPIASDAADAAGEDVPVALPVGPQEPVEEPFWAGLRANEVRLQHCPDCDRWIWEPSWVCPQCYRFDPPWQAIDPVGEVYSWTTTRHAFPASLEFSDALPYTTALVTLTNAGGRRLLGIITGGATVRIGTPVRAWIQPASELTGGWPVLRWHAVSVSARGEDVADESADTGENHG